MTKQDVLDVTYRTLMREYSEVRDMEDVNLMKKMLVVSNSVLLVLWGR